VLVGVDGTGIPTRSSRPTAPDKSGASSGVPEAGHRGRQRQVGKGKNKHVAPKQVSPPFEGRCRTEVDRGGRSRRLFGGGRQFYPQMMAEVEPGGNPDRTDPRGSPAGLVGAAHGNSASKAVMTRHPRPGAARCGHRRSGRWWRRNAVHRTGAGGQSAGQWVRRCTGRRNLCAVRDDEGASPKCSGPESLKRGTVPTMQCEPHGHGRSDLGFDVLAGTRSR
jgi:hypothetical protein